MANFENVTFEYYSETLGRAIVPTASDFNAFKLENIQLMKSWMSYVTELEENGIDNAVCLMIEKDYQDSKLLNGDSANAVSSESVQGHSISYGSNAQSKLVELNAKSTIAKKVECAKLFLSFDVGIK